MTRSLFLYVLLSVFALFSLQGQISHGGSPMPWQIDDAQLISTRSNDRLFEEMPDFDLEEQLRLIDFESSDLRNGYRFAYKFLTEYTPDNSGLRYTFKDGSSLWRLGIRSKEAHSINLLFSRFKLPEGARLFVYDPQRDQIAGAFNHRNNSDAETLPIAPIDGDELIIEYYEPANVAFRGELVLSEVNHAYRSFKVSGPMPDKGTYWCMPPLACYEDTTQRYTEIKQSVVLLIIEGTISCTGVLVNNTANDKRPFLLTASHCLNNQFTNANPDYDKVASSLLVYFNYDSPLCSPVEPGTMDQTMAVAQMRAVSEQTDMALLELTEIPPQEYNPYYAGWNATTSVKAPYAGIHHPGGSLKRLNIAEEPVELVTYSIREIAFDEYAHWKVHRWDIGATAGGSSGSPLFDANNQIIGCLTGGASTCSKPNNDYYYALSAAYEAIADSSKQLKYWLNPTTQEHPLCEGLNPYGATYTREQTLSPAEKIRIHINRENQQLEIRFDEPAELAQLSLTTPEGKTYMRLRLNPYGQSVSLSSLPTGIYILRITCNNYIYTRKLRI